MLAAVQVAALAVLRSLDIPILHPPLFGVSCPRTIRGRAACQTEALAISATAIAVIGHDD